MGSSSSQVKNTTLSAAKNEEDVCVFGSEWVVPEGETMKLHFRQKFRYFSWFSKTTPSHNFLGSKAFEVSRIGDDDQPELYMKAFNQDCLDQKVTDASDKPLFTMRDPGHYRHQAVHGADNELLFMVERAGDRGKRMITTVTDVNGKEVHATCQMNSKGTEGGIMVAGRLIAKVQRVRELRKAKVTVPGFAKEKDLILEIAPGVDAAFVMAVIMAQKKARRNYQTACAAEVAVGTAIAACAAGVIAGSIVLGAGPILPPPSTTIQMVWPDAGLNVLCSPAL